MLDMPDLICDGQSCEETLTEQEFRLAYVSENTRRRVYECTCGEVTITIGRASVGR